MTTLRLITLAALLVLTGCATNAKFQAKMDGFVGKPEYVLVGTYGPPQSSYILTDGSRVLQYTRSSQMVLPGQTYTEPVTTNTRGTVTLNQGIQQPQTTGTYNQTSTTYVDKQMPSTVINTSCTVNFTIDRAGIVQAWTASGNRCVAD
jgi:hypothetical protein